MQEFSLSFYRAQVLYSASDSFYFQVLNSIQYIKSLRNRKLVTTMKSFFFLEQPFSEIDTLFHLFFKLY